MATTRFQNNDMRRQVGSPRPKTRENKETLCRNVLIYGHCRYEDQGCTFNHEQNKNNSSQLDASKKSLNVESPSFTPASVPSGSKKATFSSQAANAPAFTPRGMGPATPDAGQELDAGNFNPAAIREFTPSFGLSSANGSAQDGAVNFDPFSMNAVGQSLPSAQYNPYADDHGGLGAGAAFFNPPGAFQTPLQPLYHLYYPHGPRPSDLMAYQRMPHEFFMPDKLREDYQRKMEAAGQILPNSALPQLDNHHSLVPLDTTHRKNASMFGYPSWVYKATSTKTGHIYALRRLEGFRLTNEHAIRSVREWRRIVHAHIVKIHDAFTTRAFGDSSLVFVQDYHALSKTLAELHIAPPNASQANRFHGKTAISEATLWTYITQIASAIMEIHAHGLSARCLDPTKIILTKNNHIRLSACSVLDVVHYEARRPIADLQQDDLTQFGRTILGLITGTLPAQMTNLKASVEQMNRTSSVELRDTVLWLLAPQQPNTSKAIDEFVRGISHQVMLSMQQKALENDELEHITMRELANGRAARLMMKLATINERPEGPNGETGWADNGEKYLLKLFRDFVFHQVDQNGNPVLNMGHMLECMAKLDAATDERICLTSRDEQTCFLVTYKEMRKLLATAFNDLAKASKNGARGL